MKLVKKQIREVAHASKRMSGRYWHHLQVWFNMRTGEINYSEHVNDNEWTELNWDENWLGDCYYPRTIKAMEAKIKFRIYLRALGPQGRYDAEEIIENAITKTEAISKLIRLIQEHSYPFFEEGDALRGAEMLYEDYANDCGESWEGGYI